MGMKTPPTVTIQDTLFSGALQRTLALLFGQPERRFHGAEIIRLAECGTGATHRQLKNLQASGLVTVTAIGNQKHYQANADSPVFAELCGLVRKTVGLRQPVSDALQSFRGDIKAAFIYGSVARGADTAASDIDLMIIGDGLDYGALYAALASAEADLGRSINPNLVSPAQWRQKIAAGNPFIAAMRGQPKVFIFGGEDDL